MSVCSFGIFFLEKCLLKSAICLVIQLNFRVIVNNRSLHTRNPYHDYSDFSKFIFCNVFLNSGEGVKTTRIFFTLSPVKLSGVFTPSLDSERRSVPKLFRFTL